MVMQPEKFATECGQLPWAPQPKAVASGGTCRSAFRAVDRSVYERVRDFLARRHKVAGRGTIRFSCEVVYGECSLLRLERRPLNGTVVCASRGGQSESRMPEIGTSGSMSEDGKRSVGHMPQATVPILDSSRARADLGRIEHPARSVGYVLRCGIFEMQHECHLRAGGQPSSSRLDACGLHQGDVGLNLGPDLCIVQARWVRLRLIRLTRTGAANAS